jgi:hypothetical protein
VQTVVVPVQTFPQAPQLFGSFCVSVHPLLHSAGAKVGQVHAPALHHCPEAHTWPHAPQLLGSSGV